MTGEKAGEVVPVPATFHYSPATSNLLDNPEQEKNL